jgi:nitroimidazol reductase NimA-like FMN-containing flavoprotein (pyridoxamine 5'-phosphate oxidase superfamily)
MATEVPVGRIGVLHDGAPEIHPVNHTVVHHSIVFRTDAGGKLEALLRSPSVSFEVGDIDAASATGSVLMKGQATEVRSAEELTRLDELRLRYWSPGDKQHRVRIVPRDVTGRRIQQGGVGVEPRA